MPELGAPAAMQRVAFVVPQARLRALLVGLAESGCVQIVGPVGAPQGEAAEALRRLELAAPAGRAAVPRLTREAVAPAQLEADGRRDLLAGEVQLERRARSPVRRGEFAVLVGWVPADELPALRQRLAADGAACVELRRPAFVEPPVLLRTRPAARAFRPLVDTYGATRYADIDPTPFAAVSFALMFGMMFGDVGHGLLLAGLGLLLRRSRNARLAPVRPLWPFLVAGGLVAAAFGLLYGEAFGPTGLVPTLWLAPLNDPVELLGAALGVGAALLAVGYALGILNRWRESGARAAVLAPSGIAGSAVFAAIALLAGGIATERSALVVAGAVVATGGALLLLAGFLAESGFSGGAVAQALVELFDAIIRVGANLVSFTRLAAFGMMHAALGLVVLDGARSLWQHGAGGALAAVAVFAVGGAAAFALETLVAGVQAMRLEYYELFSRVFAGQGDPFRPWSLPVVDYDGPR